MSRTGLENRSVSRARPGGVALLGLLALLAAAPARGAAAAELGPFLVQVSRAFQRGGEAAARPLLEARRLVVRREAGQTFVPVILVPRGGAGSAAIDRGRVRALGARVDAASDAFVRALVPISGLRRLTRHPDVERVRAPTPSVPLGLGSHVSEGVERTNADGLQTAGFSGAGVDVAVVDLGFIGLQEAIAAGELPADTVVVDLPGSSDDVIEGGTAHGVGVAEHVADMAPGATLHCIRVSDEVDLANAGEYLRANGIEIANHSVGWVNASYYDDTGFISRIVNTSHDRDGVFWSVAAGNAAERHWRGAWTDPDGDGLMNFTASDPLNELGPSSSDVAQVFLSWDQYGSSVTDLDLLILDKVGNVIAASRQAQDGTQPPTEAVAFSYKTGRAPYRIAVSHFAGPTAGLDVTLFSFGNDFEHATAASSLMDPAVAHGAFSAGAIDQADYTLGDPPLEPYSSRGPTTDGRLKPDIAAPDGTTSFTYGVESSFGTSFAAPTAAGAAALLAELRPSFTAGDLALALAHTAVDAGDSGPDPEYGAGRLFVQIQPICDDGVDNDRDGWVDYPDDPGCRGATSNLEAPQCDDGIDNDGDGDVDYPADADCRAAWDRTERRNQIRCGLLGVEPLLGAALAAALRRLRRRGRG